MTTTARAASGPTNAAGGVSRWANRHRKWVFSLPAMVFVTGLIVFPLAYTVVLSLTDARGSIRAPFDFVGVANYADVLTDTTRFWPAVARTAGFTVAAVALEMTLGFTIALLLRRPFRAQGLVRVVILLPLVATPVAVGMMWLLILEPNIGAANQILQMLGLPRSGFVTDAATALPTLVLVDVWQWTPMVALILLAGLTSLSDEAEEAARVDGAGYWARLRLVTVPMMMPTILAALLLRSIDALKTFDILYAVKGRGGGSFHEVETLNIYAYGLNFDYNDYGRASTVLVLFFLMIVGAMLLILLRRGRGHA